MAEILRRTVPTIHMFRLKVLQILPSSGYSAALDLESTCGFKQLNAMSAKSTESALAAALAQTGFPFEHHIFEQATKSGWITIPNRLYVDPEEEKTREMDLLCYRAEKGAEVMAYTALIISCKARNEKPWVLMTRPWPKQRPAWYSFPPVPVWTNSRAVEHEVNLPNWGLEYFDKAAAADLQVWADDSPEEVFAFQEFDTTKPDRFIARGDSGLYGGVMSLLKSLAYEVTALGQRRTKDKEALVYQFNLIQMLDGGLYEASFATGAPVVRRVDRYRYFARTMLNGREFSARIDFCTKAALQSLLDDLLKVHRFNVTHFNEKRRLFFENVMETQTRLNALLPLLEPRLTLALSVFEPRVRDPKPGWISLNYKKDENCLILQVDCEATCDALNANVGLVKHARSIVKDIYRYTGDLRFEDDIPF